MEKKGAYGKRVWDLDPNKFCFPDYLEFQKDLKDQFRLLKKLGISKKDLMEAWEKCGVKRIKFLSPFMYSPGRGWGRIWGDQGAPDGWKERYGSDVGYVVEFQKLEPSEIRNATKEIAKKYPTEGWSIKIKPKEFYRVLFFHEVAHTLPICGRFLNELASMPVEEKLRFEHEAWVWAVEMARQKGSKIRILPLVEDFHLSVKKKNRLEHSNFCQWYELLKRDDEMRKKKRVRP